MTQYPYQIHSTDVDIPPAPILQVTLLSPGQNQERTYKLDAFLDTGADVTLIPLEVISVLRLPLSSKKVPVVGIGGAVTIGFPCRADIQLGEKRISPPRIVGCDASAIGMQGQMIVGRDILNQLCVKFDGRRQQFSFE